jgi:hypothetical protein
MKKVVILGQLMNAIIIKKNTDGQLINMYWLSYSPPLNRIFCLTCKLFGLPETKNLFLVKNGSNDFKNISHILLK